MLQAHTFSRQHVSGHRNAAATTVSPISQRRNVVTGKITKWLSDTTAFMADAAQVATSIFYPDHPWQLGKPRHSLGMNIHYGARWNVVNDDGDIGGVMQRLEVLIQPLLRGPIVVTRHRQHRVGTYPLRGLRIGDSFARIVGTRTGNHWHLAGGFLHNDLDHSPVLLLSHGRRFASSAHRYQSVNAIVELKAQQFAQRSFVQLLV